MQTGPKKKKKKKNLNPRYGWVINAKLPPPFRQERDPVPITLEAEWAPGPI
jgi:hypothetical protein